MAHSICTADADGVINHFQRLGRTLLAPNIEPQARLNHLFELETAEFDLDYAFLSAIDLEHETERFEIVHGSHECLHPDTTVPISKTYCRKTITDPEGTLAISDALAEGWGDDPAYETFELGSYLGTTVSVDDDLYGTLCFANSEARTESFRNKEKALIEMFGQWVEYILALRDGLSIREPRVDSIEDRGVSPEAINSMMDALKSRPRRAILMTLVENTGEVSIATLERRLPQESTRTQLHHSHLPKLANAGYITWSPDADSISWGPNFSEVEPLVQLLKEYEARHRE
ncbi:GAF domain-containing protein (plasmid) [Halobacterium salinarum]|uniref:GAF domain-containing protein n=1 Tax=Halobacterium salinarum TaxID=2242 RepID=UPI0030CA5E51